MEDRKILELYLTRSEQAIRETEAKYGGYCYSVAMNILENRQDAQECVSDTWFSAWNSIPPQSPRVLATFLGSITRNLAIDRWRERRAGKRGGGEMQLALDELSGCVPGGESPEGGGSAPGAAKKRGRLSGNPSGDGTQRLPVPVPVFRQRSGHCVALRLLVGKGALHAAQDPEKAAKPS